MCFNESLGVGLRRKRIADVLKVLAAFRSILHPEAFRDAVANMKVEKVTEVLLLEVPLVSLSLDPYPHIGCNVFNIFRSLKNITDFLTNKIVPSVEKVRRARWYRRSGISQKARCFRRAEVWMYEAHIPSWPSVQESEDRILTYRDTTLILAKRVGVSIDKKNITAIFYAISEKVLIYRQRLVVWR